jgi:hypothetical protein
MMLPGVEVARKRRIHNHEIQPWGPHGHIPQPRGPLYSSMAEPALAARMRLEERLRGVSSATPSNSSSRSVLQNILLISIICELILVKKMHSNISIALLLLEIEHGLLVCGFVCYRENRR